MEYKSDFFVSCILILLLTTAAASLGYYLVMRPLRDMETALRRMAASDYTARMPCSNCRELAVLEEAFNAMADHWTLLLRKLIKRALRCAKVNPDFWQLRSILILYSMSWKRSICAAWKRV